MYLSVQFETPNLSFSIKTAAREHTVDTAVLTASSLSRFKIEWCHARKKEPSHRKIVILSVQSKVCRDQRKKADSHKLCVDWNNESGILTLAPA